jgi:hypothetical protein
LLIRNANDWQCDKKSSKARELQQDSSEKAAFVFAVRPSQAVPIISFDMYVFGRRSRYDGSNGLHLPDIAMFVSKLPPKPDFDLLAAAAPASADRRTFILALMGNLICSWSNNESLFIYVLMILLRTDEASAAVVFATLNTTRARLDLIQRLAKIRVSDKALSKNLTTLIERFSESTKVRNELNHCMFIFDSSGAITHTQSMRLVETRSSLRFGETKALDESRLQEMLRTTNEMTKINRDIWDLLPRLEAHVCGVQPKSVPLETQLEPG